MGREFFVIPVRPTIAPVLQPSDIWKSAPWKIDMAWVVNEQVVVYQEIQQVVLRSILSFAPIEKGIGGRMIEPVFTDMEDFKRRTTYLGDLEGADPIDLIRKIWPDGFWEAQRP